MAAVHDVLFEAVTRQLFGDAFADAHGAARLGTAFHAFHANFELAASPVPQFLQRAFCEGRRVLLGAFRFAVLQRCLWCSLRLEALNCSSSCLQSSHGLVAKRLA